MKWIIGEESLQRIEKLSQGLRGKILQDFPAANKPAYVPWIGIQAASSLGPIEINSPPPNHLVIDPAALKSLICLMQASEKYDISSSNMKDRINVNIGTNRDLVELYYQAISLLASSGNFYSTILEKVVEFVIPLNIRSSLGSGVSFHSMHGAVFLGIPEGEYPLATLAINLAHEIGHQILMIYQTADTLIVEDHMDLPCYSGVRKTFRPAIMTLHAAAALCHMIFACRSIIEKFPQRPFSEFMAQRTTQYQKDLSMTLQSLTKCCTFTDLGKFVVKDMLAVTDQLYQ